MRLVLAYTILGVAVASIRYHMLGKWERAEATWLEIAWEIAVWPLTLVLMAAGKL